jgi:hypothetical protein
MTKSKFVAVFGSAIRWYVSMYALFHRQTDVDLQETEGGFRTQVYTATDPADIDYAAVRAELNREVERFTNVGSGWTLTAILRFVVRIGQYRPLVGSSFIPTPASLMAKQALINVFNPDDNMCFVWAVLSAFTPCRETCRKNFEISAAFKLDRFDGIDISRAGQSDCEIRKE